MKNLLIILFVLIAPLFLQAQTDDFVLEHKWSPEKAHEWYDTHKWISGANFIPSTAINQLEMWQEDTFDPETIDRELGYAEGIGFNTMRVYLHSLAYKVDPEGFKQRMNTYLDIANKHGIQTMFVIFDDVWNPDPKPGKQPEPVTGTHNSGWMQDPGYPASKKEDIFPELEKYVKDILESFANDKRILLWDLYNEPGNSGKGNESMPLLKKVFTWAKEVNPSQPVSVGLWKWDLVDLNTYQALHSDVLTYHCYEGPDQHKRIIQLLKTHGLPMICTEYMARTNNSTFQNSMPILKEYNVGAINWGLVKGKTNTIYAWNTPIESGEEPELWFHDIFREDGTPYRQEEADLIKELNVGKQEGNKEAWSGNPVFPGWYADPEGIIFGDQYWIYPTYSAPYDEQVHFDAFSSPDLVNWTKHENILDTAEVKWAHRAMWAPSIIEKGGKYYFLFGANDIQSDEEVGGIGVAVADTPEGPYKDHLGKPLIDKFHNGAQPIDQFVFRDQDGKDYLIYGGWRHCNIAQLNDDYTGFIPFEDGETFREITPDNYVEGPFMFIRDGKYYFMWSEGGWTGPDYSVAYAIADSPMGPFERIGKILQQDPDIATGAGHHSVIHNPDSGKYYMVYHRRPKGETDRNYRVTCIDEMNFDENGNILPVKITKKGVQADPLD